MYIDSLRIENIRGIGDEDRAIYLDLQRPDGSYAGWTVLAGRNGAGKTTLLQAIAVALAGPRAALSLVPDVTGWVRQGQGTAYVYLRLAHDVKNDKIAGSGRRPGSPLPLGLNWNNSDQHFPVDPIGESDARRGPWSDRPGWFFAGYGPFRRLSGHSTEAATLMAQSTGVSALATLFREDASLAEGVQALRELYLRRMEGSQSAAALERGTIALLNDGLLPGGVQIHEVRSEGLQVTVNGVNLPLHAISDGYRATVALVLDILRRMTWCFGSIQIEYAADNKPSVANSGVVFIDEVDSHLHVSWQQRIGFWLKAHFPNIQFIVTTHSPFICQAADPRGLIRLRPDPETPTAEHLSVDEYHRVVNEGADAAVITSLFGLDTPYSQEAEVRRERLAQLEAKELRCIPLSPEETTEMEELRPQVSASPSAAVEAALRRLEEAK